MSVRYFKKSGSDLPYDFECQVESDDTLRVINGQWNGKLVQKSDGFYIKFRNPVLEKSDEIGPLTEVTINA